MGRPDNNSGGPLFITLRLPLIRITEFTVSFILRLNTKLGYRHMWVSVRRGGRTAVVYLRVDTRPIVAGDSSSDFTRKVNFRLKDPQSGSLKIH